MKITKMNKKSHDSFNQANAFHDVFISYSRQDKDFVRKLHAALKALNRGVWVDWSDIPPTAKWLAEIFAGIEAADTFICVLSPDFLASSVCSQEVEHAIKYKKRLIPIVYKEVKPDEVNPELATLNWIFFRENDDFDDALKQLIQALDTELDYLHMSSRLLVRARDWENNGYNSSFTLRGNDLEKAELWRDKATAADKKPSPSELQLRYITSSRRVATTRQRIAFGAVSLGLIVTLILSFLSYTLYQGQRRATQQALDNLATAVSRQLATEADLQAGSNPQLAALLSIAAFKTQNTPEARTSLMHQLDRVQHIDRFLSANSGPINSVAFSPDGLTLASGSNNVTLWDVTKGAPIVTLPDSALRVAFSPDGKMLAVLPWDIVDKSISARERLLG